MAFLIIGAAGLGVLVGTLFIGEFGGPDLGGADVDGPFSVPAVAALIGGMGFGGAAATALLPDSLSDSVTVVLALAVGLAVAAPLAWGAVRLARALRDVPTRESLTRHQAGCSGVVGAAAGCDGCA